MGLGEACRPRLTIFEMFVQDREILNKPRFMVLYILYPIHQHKRLSTAQPRILRCLWTLTRHSHVLPPQVDERDS